MTAIAYEIVIGYGSETGNARTLAQELASHPDSAPFFPRLMPLNEITADDLTGDAPLIIISASFGDGDPPGNAEAFLELLRQSGPLPGLRYAIFGLGDTGYPNFCGFTRQLDALLAERQATPLMNRVDADGNFRPFFETWRPVLHQVLNGDTEAGKALTLQVRAYGENNTFEAPVLAREQLSHGEGEPAWNIRLSVAGSGMAWQAGDTLNVLPENDPQLLQAIADWYGDDSAIEQLRHKELREVSKGVLRELARLADSDALKELLKFKQRKALEDYLYHADILDVLNDHATPQSVPLAELARLLSPPLIRSYSIASPDDGETIDLCVRRVRYEYNGRLHQGAATRWLLEADRPVRVYCRANPGFHMTPDPGTPIILIGTGTGIAPLLGLLRELKQRGQRRETCLIFGEKTRAGDFLYREALEALQADGVLGALHTAFSRDGARKCYVQHVIAEQGTALRALLERGAHLYLCGNKAHLEAAVSSAINQLMGDAADVPAAPDSYWRRMAREGRLHLELY